MGQRYLPRFWQFGLFAADLFALVTEYLCVLRKQVPGFTLKPSRRIRLEPQIYIHGAAFNAAHAAR